MPSRVVKRSKKVGFSSGSLIHIGNKYTEKSKITLIHYDKTFYWEKHLDTLTDINNISLFQKKEVDIAAANLLH